MTAEFDFDWSGGCSRTGPVEPLRPRRERAGRTLRLVKNAVNEPIPPEWDVLIALIEDRRSR